MSTMHSMVCLETSLCGVSLKNPCLTASGTFGSGREYEDFVDLNQLGGITVKGVSPKPWKGNPPPRIVETEGGMLNAVGLQNPGVRYFMEQDLPYLKRFDTRIIVNICGHSVEEYVEVAEALQDAAIDFLELNISCPNISQGGLAFGTDCGMVERVVKAVKAVAKQPLIVKLSPNVTDITETARAAESAGADALSLINTLLGMKIDIRKRQPVLANKLGGLSGPAIKPVALRMVWQVAKAVKLPLIGMGGIACAEDAIEFIMAGATAFAVGTANFNKPSVTIEIIEGIKKYCIENTIKGINEIKGIV